jgi:ParB/RepB/Spo0J family partition protein
LKIDEAAFTELMASIREHGLLQPITIRKAGARYQVIAGHRPLEAFRRPLAATVGQGQGAIERFRTIPAHEKFDVSDDEMAPFVLVENLQRQELSPLEAAAWPGGFQETHLLSAEALSKRTALEPDRVKRLVRLARAPRVVQDARRQGVLVDHVDERGAVKLLPSGIPKRERIRLDLMAALDFAKLHARAMKSSPKKADAAGVEQVAPAASPALFTDGAELRVRRS